MHSKKMLLACLVCAVGFLSACTFPKGAPTKSEVIGSNPEDAAELDIAAVEVTRSNLGQISKWPVTGWHGHYHWIAAERGPLSNVIRPGDSLNLLIWDNSDNSLLTGLEERNVEMPLVEVGASGNIFVPYVENVRVAGLTVEQARELLQGRLSKIAPSIQVQVVMEEGASNSVDAVAGLATPGTYPLPSRNHSIRSLIAQAGGIDPAIENPLVRLTRNGQNYEIPADELFRSASKNVILRGGDQIIIEEDPRYFTLFGATLREEMVHFPQESLTALEAVSLGGGILDTRANPEGLLVLREYPQSAVRSGGGGPDNQYVVFVLNLASADGLFAAKRFQINPGDTILATESAVGPTQAAIALLGSAVAIISVANN